MAPVGYGFLNMLASSLVIAVLVGAIGGAIHGWRRGDLARGALLVTVADVLVCTALGWWKLALAGLLPMILVFLVGSIATRLFATRVGLHPGLAAGAGFGVALAAGVLYLLPIRLGEWEWVDPQRAWLALAILLFLVFLSVRRRWGHAK